MHTLWPGLPLTNGPSYCSQSWKSTLTQQDLIKTVLIPPGLVPWSFPLNTLHPVPPIVAHWSPMFLKITHLLSQLTYIHAHYIRHFLTLSRCFSDATQTVTCQVQVFMRWERVVLERLYCAAQVNTNVVLQFSAHNTRDREIIKHCTGKQRIKVYNLHILS